MSKTLISKSRSYNEQISKETIYRDENYTTIVFETRKIKLNDQLEATISDFPLNAQNICITKYPNHLNLISYTFQPPTREFPMLWDDFIGKKVNIVLKNNEKVEGIITTIRGNSLFLFTNDEVIAIEISNILKMSSKNHSSDIPAVNGNLKMKFKGEKKNDEEIIEISYKINNIYYQFLLNVIFNEDESELRLYGRYVLFNQSNKDFNQAILTIKDTQKIQDDSKVDVLKSLSSKGRFSRLRVSKQQTNQESQKVLHLGGQRLVESKNAILKVSNIPNIYPIQEGDLQISLMRNEEVYHVCIDKIFDKKNFKRFNVIEFGPNKFEEGMQIDRNQHYNTSTFAYDIIEIENSQNGIFIPECNVEFYHSYNLIGTGKVKTTKRGEVISLTLEQLSGITASKSSKLKIEDAFLTEDIEIKIKNSTHTNGVNVIIRDHIARWKQFEIIKSSHKFTLNGNVAQFEVPVEFEGVQYLTYTIQYKLKVKEISQDVPKEEEQQKSKKKGSFFSW